MNDRKAVSEFAEEYESGDATINNLRQRLGLNPIDANHANERVIKMESKKIVSQIIGMLVERNISAKEVMVILDETKDVFLDRSFHVSSKKKNPHIATTISEEVDKYENGEITLNELRHRFELEQVGDNQANKKVLKGYSENIYQGHIVADHETGRKKYSHI
ncbi:MULTISPECIES: hypothetical protein [unclassified Oceanobacillus]|uniref:hypothetical protein n=1 Tax=unclassified Oceanobacillus TaxID=2630292 RepID=UPI001BE77CCF|nr:MULTISPECIES: hypothetical protein [unclassified Oceanobacillus]MBT2600914.1 hypothetical protein [Oceanobacillus sp. ISL-74]MBT2653425.1 hypothetical protein [Oceanobacillus sp. ISL-73]